MSFLYIESLTKMWFGVWFLIQLPLILLIFILSILFYPCCGRNNNQNNPPEVPPAPVDNIEANRNLEPLNLFADPQILNQEGNQNVDRQGADVPNLLNFFNALIERFEEGINNIERQNSVKMLGMITANWKRKYTQEDVPHSPNCCVCLDQFNLDEDIIELHCNPNNHGHIFHPMCINSWSEKEKTCPL